jgi:hypothetical protein
LASAHRCKHTTSAIHRIVTLGRRLSDIIRPIIILEFAPWKVTLVGSFRMRWSLCCTPRLTPCCTLRCSPPVVRKLLAHTAALSNTWPPFFWG